VNDVSVRKLDSEAPRVFDTEVCGGSPNVVQAGSAKAANVRTAMRARVAAVFCMPERGHLQRFLPLIESLSQSGMTVRVYTHEVFRKSVEHAGGQHIDLFAQYPLDAADASSQPIPCRYVSFAAHYADELIQEMRRVKPSLILYDTFAVIGFLLGRHLGIPYINVCSGHNMSPLKALAFLQNDRRNAPSDRCLKAVEVLRDQWEICDASPSSYMTGLSPFLNVYCEPRDFLRPEEMAGFEPIAFFGSLSLSSSDKANVACNGSPWLRTDVRGLRLYASFGTVVWRYFEKNAVLALEAISDAVAEIASAQALISLGGYALPVAALRRLERHNVRVANFVNQWEVLQSANACVTHNGLNSTHEIIFNRVPMISYPFFGDQPVLAARCRELGMAIPLSSMPLEPISPENVHNALARIDRESDAIAANLARARQWEIDTIRERPAVIRQILAFAS
jgi:MGT family glycosyltransferase